MFPFFAAIFLFPSLPQTNLNASSFLFEKKIKFHRCFNISNRKDNDAFLSHFFFSFNSFDLSSKTLLLKFYMRQVQAFKLIRLYFLLFIFGLHKRKTRCICVSLFYFRKGVAFVPNRFVIVFCCSLFSSGAADC